MRLDPFAFATAVPYPGTSHGRTLYVCLYLVSTPVRIQVPYDLELVLTVLPSAIGLELNLLVDSNLTYRRSMHTSVSQLYPYIYTLAIMLTRGVAASYAIS